jgi:hypothetical protein
LASYRYNAPPESKNDQSAGTHDKTFNREIPAFITRMNAFGIYFCLTRLQGLFSMK